MNLIASPSLAMTAKFSMALKALCEMGCLTLRLATDQEPQQPPCPATGTRRIVVFLSFEKPTHSSTHLDGQADSLETEPHCKPHWPHVPHTGSPKLPCGTAATITVLDSVSPPVRAQRAATAAHFASPGHLTTRHLLETTSSRRRLLTVIGSAMTRCGSPPSVCRSMLTMDMLRPQFTGEEPTPREKSSMQLPPSGGNEPGFAKASQDLV